MYNPQVILTELIVLLKAIPELVTALGGDASKISAFADSYPENNDLTQAVQALPHPSLLVAYSGTTLNQYWVHSYSMFIGLPEESAPPYNGPHAIFHAVANGAPTSRPDGQPIYALNIKDGAFAVQPPTLQRRSVFVGADQRFDYWEIQLAVREAGHNV